MTETMSCVEVPTVNVFFVSGLLFVFEVLIIVFLSDLKMYFSVLE